MAEADDSQKTEQPTGRKLSRARSEGQVVQSREINNLFMLSVGAALMLLLAPSLGGKLVTTLARFLDPASLMTADGVLWSAVVALMGKVALAFVLPLVLLVAAALAGSLMQTGLVVAVEKIGFDLSRISLIGGFGRLFSLRAAIDFLKNVAKFALVIAGAGWLMLPEISRLPMLSRADAIALLAELHHQLLHLAIGVLVAVALLALVDYAYQHYSFMRSMRMSKQEVKEENKQSEGDPIIKGRLRHIRMERARKRMMAAVPTASVVVTNPTHFAVALKYDMGSKGAPKVVAKGADLVAQRIREIARENDVPLVENPPLARALYASVELDHEIPPEHYRAVAEIISYVFRIKGKLKQASR